MTTPNTAAPSAAPAGTPAIVPPPSPAPSAPTTPNPVLTLADYDALASQSLQANAQPPAVPSPTPAPAPTVPGTEPSPAPAPAAPAPVVPPVQTPGSDDVPDVTPEELAPLSEAGRRALQAERAERKAAKAESRELKAKLAELEAKLATPPPPAPEPITPPPAAVPTPSVATPALADCTTFEAVEARGLAAAQTEALVAGLQSKLQYQGPEAVLAELAAQGIEKIGNTPVAEATPEVLANFLGTALNGAKLTQAQVAPRKRFLAAESSSFAEAVKLVPDMAKPDSPVARGIAEFVRQNPMVRNDARWPVLAAKLYLGELAIRQAQTPAPAPATPATIVPAPQTIPAPVVPALKAAPGAPATSSAALPASNRLAEIQAKLRNGTATDADVNEYGRLSLLG